MEHVTLLGKAHIITEQNLQGDMIHYKVKLVYGRKVNKLLCNTDFIDFM